MNRHHGRCTAGVAAGAICLTTALTTALVVPAASTAAHAAPSSLHVASPTSRPWLDATLSPEERAAALVAQMTLDEKISQTHTTGSGVARKVVGIPRLGIPDFNITNGPAGVGTGTTATQPTATALPAPVAVAASFDDGLSRAYGDVEGRETLAVNHDLIEAPDVNIVRVPQGGRDFENYSEDPYLSARMAVANVRGIQSQGAISEVKHYVANNQETDRKTVDELVDDRTLHEIYMPAFEAAVEQGHVGAVMCAYPQVNGEFMCENQHLLDGVIRDQWGFDGFIQSDYTATHTAVGSANAGMDLELRDNGPYDGELKQAVLDGRVSMQQLDTMIERRLATEIRMGVFDQPADTTAPIDVTGDAAVAREVAEQGTVLLKNEGRQLPLDPAALHSVAVIGPYAEKAHPGGGGSSHVNPFYTVSPVQGIQARLGDGVVVRHSDGSDLTAAADQAAASDVAVVVVGEEEAEGSDRSTLALPGDQDALVRAVTAANPHTVVVLDTGAPVLMPWVDQVPAILEAWYPGEEDGNALAAVLFGDVNPSGKLPVTFPRSEDETPVSDPARFPGIDGTATYSEGLDVGYRWYDDTGVTPLFPFGYGLSYTSFAMSDLSVDPGPRPGKTALQVSVAVRNTGTVAGSETPQVYLQLPASSGEPPKRLVAFTKVHLLPGQTKTVHLTVDPANHSMSVWDTATQSWSVPAGTFTVRVGDSSADVPLSASVTVPSSTH